MASIPPWSGWHFQLNMPESAPSDAHAKAVEAVQSIFDRWIAIADDTGFDGFDLRVMKEAKVLDASLGPPSAGRTAHVHTEPGPAVLASATTSLPIDRTYRNIRGAIHGGAYGVIFDMLTTIALGPLSRPGYWDFLGGVARSLSINYLKAVPVDTTIIVYAHVYQVGRTMAYIKGWMTSEDGATVYATCDHHKVGLPSLEAHMAYKVPWDGQWGTKTDPKL